MTITTRAVEYDHQGATLEGVLAYDTTQEGPRPGVLVAHAWAGRTEFEIDVAERLAGLGYAGFALDLYGKGVRGTSTEENQALMTPFVEDRAMLQSRLLHIVDIVKDLPEVNAGKVAACGFCFGGLCVLDIARTGADLRGVASFHGLFGPPGNTAGNKVKAKVIAFHGWDDPMVPPDDVVKLGRELTEAGADWQIHAYGGTMHAFTNPEANDPDFGTVYSEIASERSWASFEEFLAEIFA
ncbi:MAG: dienelactone hydrolase family protein [Parvularculaceae bacterium]